MISVLPRAIAAIRVWLGLNEPAENRLHPSHGWLLRPAADVRRGLGLTPAVAPARAPSSLGERR